MVGDLMQHREQLDAAYNPATNSYDYSDCFQAIQPILNLGDLTIGNLETTLAGTEYSQYRGWPRFNSPDEFALALKRAGFNLLITANNHSVDHFGHGMERTIKVLDSFGIDHTGTFLNQESRDLTYPYIVNEKGFRIAVLAYTDIVNILPVPAPYILNRAFEDQIKADLEKAKEMEPDFIITYMHWGNEYKNYPSSRQRILAEFLYDNGADFVVGAHPHVVQTIDKRGYLGPVKNNPGLIVYSLGNFISDFSGKYTQGGLIFEIVLERTGNGDVAIQDYGFLPTWVDREEAERYVILPVSEIEADRITYALADVDRTKLELHGANTRLQLNNGSYEIQYYLSDETLADFEEHLQIAERRVTKATLTHDPPIAADPLAVSEIESEEIDPEFTGEPVEMQIAAEEEQRPNEEILGYDNKGNPIYRQKRFLKIEQVRTPPEPIAMDVMREFRPIGQIGLDGKKIYMSNDQLYQPSYEADAGVPPPKGYYDDMIVAVPAKERSIDTVMLPLPTSTPKIFDTIYRVQFMAANKKIDVNTAVNTHLQGYEVVKENGFFKYVLGETPSLEEIKRTCANVRAGGNKDAFIVMYVQGERIKNIFEL